LFPSSIRDWNRRPLMMRPLLVPRYVPNFWLVVCPPRVSETALIASFQGALLRGIVEDQELIKHRGRSLLSKAVFVAPCGQQRGELCLLGIFNDKFVPRPYRVRFP
jgi:hypothetical protein